MRLPICPEGAREMLISTLVLGGLAWLATLVYWPLALIPVVVWIWVISFFRDPRRVPDCKSNEFCSPADGTVTEITRLEHHDVIGGPALKLGIFLSLFNVHVNRSPCGGKVRAIDYQPGKYHDARKPESSTENEANTLVIDPDKPLSGPIIVRQVAGLVARRIICNVNLGKNMPIGHRFGMIKFGSRTELIIPAHGAEITVKMGEKVKGGLTIVARKNT